MSNSHRHNSRIGRLFHCPGRVTRGHKLALHKSLSHLNRHMRALPSCFGPDVAQALQWLVAANTRMRCSCQTSRNSPIPPADNVRAGGENTLQCWHGPHESGTLHSLPSKVPRSDNTLLQGAHGICTTHSPPLKTDVMTPTALPLPATSPEMSCEPTSCRDSALDKNQDCAASSFDDSASTAAVRSSPFSSSCCFPWKSLAIS